MQKATIWWLVWVVIVLAFLISLPYLRGIDGGDHGAPILWLRWGAAVVLLSVFVIFAGGNIGIALRWYLWRQRASTAPLAGGVAGMLAFLVVPWPTAHWWWWLPLLLDIGCVPLLLAGLCAWGLRWFRRDKQE